MCLRLDLLIIGIQKQQSRGQKESRLLRFNKRVTIDIEVMTPFIEDNSIYVVLTSVKCDHFLIVI